MLRNAQWHIPTSLIRGDIDELCAWFRRWKVPRYAYLVDNDNRFLIDSLSTPSIELLRDQIRRFSMKAVVVEEMYPSPDELFLEDASGQKYVSELFATVSTASNAGKPFNKAASRVSAVGVTADSEWIYLQLYTNRALADGLIKTFICGELLPILQVDNSYEWHFVRYRDTRFHVRLRVRVGSKNFAAAVAACQNSLLQAVERGVVDRFAISQYVPEPERYGGPALLRLAERCFTESSKLASKLVSDGIGVTFEKVSVAIISLRPLIDSFFDDDPFMAAYLKLRKL